MKKHQQRKNGSLYLILVMIFCLMLWASCFEVTDVSAVIYPESIDNGDGTYTLAFQPSGGANDGTDEGGLFSGKDAWDLQNQDSETVNTNFGDSPWTLLCNSTCNYWIGKSYYQFDVSELPPSEEIVSVKLVLYHWLRRGYNWPWQADPTTMAVRSILEPWNEMTVTFANPPAVSPYIEAEVNLSTPQYGYFDAANNQNIVFQGPVKIDITELYKAWRNGTQPNYGIAYSRENRWCENANATQTATSDNEEPDKRPKLEIIYFASDTNSPLGSDSCQDQMTQANSKIQELEDDLAICTDSIKTLEDDYDDVAYQLHQMQNQLTEARASQEALKQENQNLQNQMVGMNSTITSLRLDLTEAESGLTEIQNLLTTPPGQRSSALNYTGSLGHYLNDTIQMLLVPPGSNIHDDKPHGKKK
jgi:hypothetical protein